MTHKSFDTLDGVTDFMAATEQAAMANLTPEQRVMADQYGWDITEPVHWIRFYPEAGCFIFGRTHTANQIADNAARCVPSDLAVEGYDKAVQQAVDTVRSTKKSRARGYMYGDAYSILAPRGELGQTHVANVSPITQEEFDEAERCDWDIPPSSAPSV